MNGSKELKKKNIFFFKNIINNNVTINNSIKVA